MSATGQLISREEKFVAGMIAKADEIRGLIRAAPLREILKMHTQLEMASKYASRFDELEVASVELSELAAQAAIRGGALLAEMDRVGHRPEKGSSVKPFSMLRADLGISKSRSSRWQAVARVPEKLRNQHIASMVEKRKHVTISSLMKLVPKQNGTRKGNSVQNDRGRKVDDLSELSGEKFATIYADPPWAYGNQATRASTDNHYQTMSVADICAMPVAELADDNAQLHLWTTNGFLRESFEVIDAWGFSFRSCFVWCKSGDGQTPKMGIGNYWRVSHEFLLLGIRGSATFEDKSLASWAALNRGSHSAKPEAVREMIEKAFHGPRLELFGRMAIPGWTVFGNQVERSLFAG